MAATETRTETTDEARALFEAALKRPSAAELVTFSPAQKNLLKRTLCKPKDREATDEEVSLFLGYCKRTALDPFAKQIYAIFRAPRSGARQELTVQTSIDGFRVIAERTGRYLGGPPAMFCGPDKQWTEVWTESVPPVAARVTVRKVVGPHIAETAAIALWREYKSNQGLWDRMPANQLAKCTEALALRRAFPNDLSGLYTDDEMAQAGGLIIPATATEAPEEVADAEVVEAQTVELDEIGKLAVSSIEGLTRAEKWTMRDVKQQLVAAGAQDTSKVSAALMSMTLEQREAFASMVVDLAAEIEQEPAQLCATVGVQR